MFQNLGTKNILEKPNHNFLKAGTSIILFQASESSRCSVFFNFFKNKLALYNEDLTNRHKSFEVKL